MTWAPDYVELADLRAFLRIDDDEDTADDDLLGDAISAASRAVDRSCGRQFGAAGASVTRYYTAKWSRELGRYFADIDDLADGDDLTVTSGGTAVTDYTLLPLNAEADGKPYTRVVFTASVSTADGAIAITSDAWGWASFPAPVVYATKLQAARLVKRRDAPFGIAGSPDTGSELRLLARLDPDVEVLLSSVRRWWGAR
jgi:hypothetical protein